MESDELTSDDTSSDLVRQANRQHPKASTKLRSRTNPLHAGTYYGQTPFVFSRERAPFQGYQYLVHGKPTQRIRAQALLHSLLVDSSTGINLDEPMRTLRTPTRNI